MFAGRILTRDIVNQLAVRGVPRRTTCKCFALEVRLREVLSPARSTLSVRGTVGTRGLC